MTGNVVRRAAPGVAAVCGLLALAGAFATKSQRLYLGDAETGATLATEGVRPWMLLVVLLAVVALAALGWADRSAARREASAAAAAGFAAAAFGALAVLAVARLAGLAAEASAADYRVLPGAGLRLIAVVGPVGAAAAVVCAVLVGCRTNPGRVG